MYARLLPGHNLYSSCKDYINYLYLYYTTLFEFEDDKSTMNGNRLFFFIVLLLGESLASEVSQENCLGENFSTKIILSN